MIKGFIMVEDKRNCSPKYFLNDSVIVASGHERAGLMGHIIAINNTDLIYQLDTAPSTWIPEKFLLKTQTKSEYNGDISLRIDVASRIAQGLIANETWMKNKVSDAKLSAFGNVKEAANIVKESIVNDALEIADALIYKCKSDGI